MYNSAEYLPFFQVIPRNVGYSFSVPFQLCQADPNRVILFVTAPASAPVYLYLPGDNMNTNFPRFVISANATARIDWKDWGPLVTYELWFINLNNLPNQLMQVTEVRWLPPSDQWTGLSSSTTVVGTDDMRLRPSFPGRVPYSASPPILTASSSDTTAPRAAQSVLGSGRLLPPVR